MIGIYAFKPYNNIHTAFSHSNYACTYIKIKYLHIHMFFEQTVSKTMNFTQKYFKYSEQNAIAIAYIAVTKRNQALNSLNAYKMNRLAQIMRRWAFSILL